MLVKIINYNTLKSADSSLLLCMLAVYVLTVSNCVWICNSVQILKGHRSIIENVDVEGRPGLGSHRPTFCPL